MLLSGTVILHEHDKPPRGDKLLLHVHEGIDIQRGLGRVADGDLMLRGSVKPGARIRHKLGSLRFIVDSKTPCLALAVECHLEGIFVGFWESVRYEVNRRPVEDERRGRLLISVACGKIKTIECVSTL